MSPGVTDSALAGHAARFEAEAQTERRSMIVGYRAAFVLGVAAVVLSVIGALSLPGQLVDVGVDQRAGSDYETVGPATSAAARTAPVRASASTDLPAATPPPESGHTSVDAVSSERRGDHAAIVLAGWILAPLGCSVFALLAVRQAERHRRQANEYVRIAAQLGLIEPFTSGLPSKESHVLRGAIAPLIFSRTLDDDDPLRATPWPSPDQLHELLTEATSSPPQD